MPFLFSHPQFPWRKLTHNQGFNSYPGIDVKGKPVSQTSLWSPRLIMTTAYLTFLTLPPYPITHVTVNIDMTTRPIPPPMSPTQDALFLTFLRPEACESSSFTSHIQSNRLILSCQYLHSTSLTFSLMPLS